MEFKFAGDLSEIQNGLNIVAQLLGWTMCENGVPVHVIKTDEKEMSVIKTKCGWEIKYPQKAHFFRALGFLNQQKEVCEVANFKNCGFHLDLSQTNEVPYVEVMSEIMCRMALMGFNLMVLYMEDNFDVPEEPYFGYMRSRYSEEELKAIVGIGELFGIEIIPAVEGLSHLRNILRWPGYSTMKEDESTVLVGEPRTYEYLGHVLDVVKRNFRSGKVIVEMDEAFGLGRGESLTRSGKFIPSWKLLKEHSDKVVDLCKERNLKVITCADSYMLAANPTGHPFERLYNTDNPMPQEIIDAAKRPVEYIMWDYSHLDEQTYEKLYARYREFGNCTTFLAGIWNWLGFGVDYDKTFATIIPGMHAAKKANIETVAVSVWGNDTSSENFWCDSLLGMQLFAEYAYGDEPSEEELGERFKACTGCEMKDFKEMSYLDHLYGEAPKPGPDYTNFTRSLLWQDILFGRYDYYIHDNSLSNHFARNAEALEQATLRNGKYGKYFEIKAMCSRVMEIKATLGYRISEAYKNNDIDELRSILEIDLSELKNRIDKLYVRHRELWYEIHKPLGWEVEDLRYGALVQRIDAVKYRINQYLNGEVKELPELTETRRSVTGDEKMPRAFFYLNNLTASFIEPKS